MKYHNALVISYTITYLLIIWFIICLSIKFKKKKIIEWFIKYTLSKRSSQDLEQMLKFFEYTL